jgi:hypothetical protein
MNEDEGVTPEEIRPIKPLDIQPFPGKPTNIRLLEKVTVPEVDNKIDDRVSTLNIILLGIKQTMATVITLTKAESPMATDETTPISTDTKVGMFRSLFMKLGLRDLAKGALVAALTAGATGLAEILNIGLIPTINQGITNATAAASAGVAYLVKNLFTNSKGEILKTEPVPKTDPEPVSP